MIHMETLREQFGQLNNAELAAKLAEWQAYKNSTYLTAAIYAAIDRLSGKTHDPIYPPYSGEIES